VDEVKPFDIPKREVWEPLKPGFIVPVSLQPYAPVSATAFTFTATFMAR